MSFWRRTGDALGNTISRFGIYANCLEWGSSFGGWWCGECSRARRWALVEVISEHSVNAGCSLDELPTECCRLYTEKVQVYKLKIQVDNSAYKAKAVATSRTINYLVQNASTFNKVISDLVSTQIFIIIFNSGFGIAA